MEKADIKNRIDTIRDNAKKNKGKKGKEKLRNPNEKMCPFRDQVCDSRCRLFRNRQGYECPFMEISSISWNLRDVIKILIGK